jgi:hypothetical protein
MLSKYFRSVRTKEIRLQLSGIRPWEQLAKNKPHNARSTLIILVPSRMEERAAFHENRNSLENEQNADFD